MVRSVLDDKELEGHDSLVLVLMAHGKVENGKLSLAVKNGYVDVDELIQYLNVSNHFHGKPKLIFLQCCRGGKYFCKLIQ